MSELKSFLELLILASLVDDGQWALHSLDVCRACLNILSKHALFCKDTYLFVSYSGHNLGCMICVQRSSKWVNSDIALLPTSENALTCCSVDYSIRAISVPMAFLAIVPLEDMCGCRNMVLSINFYFSLCLGCSSSQRHFFGPSVLCAVFQKFDAVVCLRCKDWVWNSCIVCVNLTFFCYHPPSYNGSTS